MGGLHPIRDSEEILKRSLIKEAVWKRDGRKCFYCNRKLKYNRATMDHIEPECFGGLFEYDNLVAVCFPCNQKRANMPADIFLTLMMTGGFPDKQKSPAVRPGLQCEP